MKFIFFSFILLVLTFFETKAQGCKSSCSYYDDFIKMAEDNKVKKTQKKLDYYRAAIAAARDCNCPELEKSAYKRIDALFILIEAEKRKAESQAKTILKQQKKIGVALTEAESANKKNIKIVNAMDFYDGKFALAFKNGKYGFIDKDGNPNRNIDFEYDRGEPFNSYTGFAEMEKINLEKKRTKYLIDTSGNRYRLVNISEILREKGIVKSIFSTEEIALLKSKLGTDRAERKILSKLKDIESDMASLNKELADELNQNKELLALDFSKIAEDDILSILQYLTKESKINYRVELLLFGGKNLDVFPESITKFEKLKKIDIYTTQISSIPETIGNLKDLKILNLSRFINSVPSSIYDLENLETLDLYHTKTKTLPEKIGNLRKLKTISLPNTLEELPSNIYNLKNLEYLNLLFVKVEELPEAIGGLQRLKTLVLPRGLRKIPFSIYSLKNLEYLDLSSTNEKELSESIENLKKLKTLKIRMPLESLPSSIGNLKNLEVLNLSETMLKELPESIGNLKKLKKLYLPSTIETLPKGIGNLKNLEKLDLYYTNLKVLPENVGNLENLERLRLPSTLEMLPESIGNLKKLKFLYLNHTKLKVLPKSIGNLEKLKNVDLPLTLETLPETTGNLKNLEILDLSKTTLKTLPESIGKLVNLKKLRLPSTLEVLPKGIGDLISIEKLYLNGAALKTFPNIGKLVNLETLNLPSTLEVLPKGIGNLKNLESLDLADLKLKTLPEDIGKLVNLKELYLPPTLEAIPDNIISNLIKLKTLDVRKNQNLKKVPDLSKMKNLESFYFTLYKNDNYTDNQARLKVLVEEHPKCLFFISDENGKIIFDYVKGI